MTQVYMMSKQYWVHIRSVVDVQRGPLCLVESLSQKLPSIHVSYLGQ